MWSCALSTGHTSITAIVSDRVIFVFLARSGERASSCFMQDHGLSPLPWGRQRRPIIRSIRTLRIRQAHGLNGSTALSTSPLRAASILTPNHFHEVSRAKGPRGQARKCSRQESIPDETKGVSTISSAHASDHDFHELSRAAGPTRQLSSNAISLDFRFNVDCRIFGPSFHQYSYGCESDDDAPEVNTQRVKD